MSICNVTDLSIISKVDNKQKTPRKEILVVQGYAFIQLIHSIIREYGTYSHGTYSVDINTLSLTDKRLLLGHVLDSGEFKWACENPTRLNAMFDEHKSYFEELICNGADEVYREDMEEAGCVAQYHRDNGECYWVRR